MSLTPISPFKKTCQWILGTVFVSCLTVVYSNPARAQNPPDGLLPEPLMARGTSDSGGCNGVQNKCFDSYIVNLENLPAYKNVVEPLFKNLKSKSGHSLTDVRKLKPWYIAPVRLAKLNKDALGVSFIDSEIQQLVLQSIRAVWIDQDIFDSMSEQDQGELILHEIVMSLYFMRYMSFTEFCNYSKVFFAANDDKNNDCENVPKIFAELMKPEPWHPLTAEDNERIRFATSWLVQNATVPNEEINFIRVLELLKFDSRFFKAKNYEHHEKTEPEFIKITLKELQDALRATELTNNMPDTCTDSNLSISKPCELKFDKGPVIISGFQIPGVNYQFTLDGNAYTPLSTWGETQSLSVFQGSDPKKVAFISALSLRKSYAVGDVVDMALFFFKKEGQGYLLDSALVRRGVITSVDKTKEQVCTVMNFKPKKEFENGFIFHHQGESILDMQMIETSFVPAAMCTPQNTVE